MKNEQPEGDDLQGFEAPTEEQAKALREGFAAHVSANAEFQQAVKGLMKTQNPRAHEQLLERQFVPKVEVDEQADSAELGHPTVRVERPFGALLDPEAERDGAHESAGEPAAPSQRDAEQASDDDQTPPARTRERTLVALVALAALAVGGIFAFLLMTGPSDVADGPGPRQQPTALAPTVATTATGAAPSLAPAVSQTAAPSSTPSSSPSATAKPQGTGSTSSRVPSVRSTSSSDTKDPDGWRFNP